MTTTPSAEPPEATPTVASELLALLKLEGVGHVFGIPGGALICNAERPSRPTTRSRITRVARRPVPPSSPTATARVSGGLGVVLVTSGPGATNALTGAINADASHSPLLVRHRGSRRSSTSGAATSRREPAQISTSSRCTATRSAYSEIITNASNFQELFESAMRTRLGHASPRHSPQSSQRCRGEPRHGLLTALEPHDLSGRAAASSIAAASKVPSSAIARRNAHCSCSEPLVVGPCRTTPCAQTSSRRVERLAVPVLTSPDAKGVFPGDSRSSPSETTGSQAAAGRSTISTTRRLGTTTRWSSSAPRSASWRRRSTASWSPELIPDGPLHPAPRGSLGDRAGLSDHARRRRRVGGALAELRAGGTGGGDRARHAGRLDERRQFVADSRTVFSPFTDPDKRTS